MTTPCLSQSPNLLTVEGLAARLALSPRTLRNWLYRGVCPVRPVRIRNAVRFDQRDVQAFIDAQREAAPLAETPQLQPLRRGRGRPRKDAGARG